MITQFTKFGDQTRIELVASYGRSDIITIDTEDLPLAMKSGLYIYYRKNKPSYVKTRDGKIFHRLITNAQNGQIVDHINRDTFDNRKQNLRFVDWSVSNFNKKIAKNGVQGIRWDKNARKWRAEIGKDGKRIYIGNFNTREEAIRWRKEAEIKYYGVPSPI